MRAAIFHEHGGPDVVRIEDVAVPEPGPGEVLLQVAASAMNHLDLWVRRGLPIETTMPHIGGSDVVGTIVGDGRTADERTPDGRTSDGRTPDERTPHERTPDERTSNERTRDERTRDGRNGRTAHGRTVVVNPSLFCGECEWCVKGEEPLCVRYRILGEHTNGGFAEYVAVPAKNLLEVPEGFPVERAAAGVLAYLTAWRGLVTRARLQPGESVLVTGASGGVATAAVQIAKHVGARVYAVTTGEHVAAVRALGADVVYDRTRVDFAKQLWQDTNKRGVDVVLDSVGSATWAGVFRSLARLGRLVVYGATTGPQAEIDLRVLFWKQCEVLGTTMSTQAEFEAVMSLIFDGTITPVIDSVLPLEQARAAHERLEAGEQFGKIVLVP